MPVKDHTDKPPAPECTRPESLTSNPGGGSAKESDTPNGPVRNADRSDASKPSETPPTSMTSTADRALNPTHNPDTPSSPGPQRRSGQTHRNKAGPKNQDRVVIGVRGRRPVTAQGSRSTPPHPRAPAARWSFRSARIHPHRPSYRAGTNGSNPRTASP